MQDATKSVFPSLAAKSGVLLTGYLISKRRQYAVLLVFGACSELIWLASLKRLEGIMGYIIMGKHTEIR